MSDRGLSELQRHTLVECRIRANTILNLVRYCLEEDDLEERTKRIRTAACDISTFASALEASTHED